MKTLGRKFMAFACALIVRVEPGICNEFIEGWNDTCYQVVLNETELCSTCSPFCPVSQGNSFGYLYAELFYEIYDLWELELDGIAIITESSHRGLTEDIILNLHGGTSLLYVIFDERNDLSRNLYSSSTFVVVGNSSFLDKVIIQASNQNIITRSNAWFLLETDGHSTKNLDMFTGYNMFVITNDKNSSLTNYSLTPSVVSFTIRPLVNNSDEQQLVFTTWLNMHQNKLNVSFNITSGSFKLAKPQLERTIRISVVHEPPYVFKSMENNKSVYTGYLIDILNKIIDIEKFDYIIQDCTDGIHGIKTGREWSGCISDLINFKADMILTPMAVTSEREKAVDFISPYLGVSGLQVIRRKKISSGFFFLDVFTVPVWLSSVAVMFVTSCLVYLFQRFNTDSNTATAKKVSIGDIVWFIISSLCFEGLDEGWLTSVGRFLVSGYWFFCTIMMACFTANMAAFLTNIRLVDDSITVYDKLRSKITNFTIVKDSSEHDYIKNIADIEDKFINIWKQNMYSFSTGDNYTVWTFPFNALFSKIMKQISTHDLPVSIASAMELLDKNFELILDSKVASYYHSIDCSLVICSHPIAMHPVGIAVAQGSRIKDRISKSLLALQHNQEIDYLRRKWWRLDTCDHDVDGSLSLDTLRGTFYALPLGVVISFIILGGEILFSKIKAKMLHRRTVSPNRCRHTSISGINDHDIESMEQYVNEEEDTFHEIYTISTQTTCVEHINLENREEDQLH